MRAGQRRLPWVDFRGHRRLGGSNTISQLTITYRSCTDRNSSSLMELSEVERLKYENETYVRNFDELKTRFEESLAARELLEETLSSQLAQWERSLEEKAAEIEQLRQQSIPGSQVVFWKEQLESAEAALQQGRQFELANIDLTARVKHLTDENNRLRRALEDANVLMQESVRAAESENSFLKARQTQLQLDSEHLSRRVALLEREVEHASRQYEEQVSRTAAAERARDEALVESDRSHKHLLLAQQEHRIEGEALGSNLAAVRHQLQVALDAASVARSSERHRMKEQSALQSVSALLEPEEGLLHPSDAAGPGQNAEFLSSRVKNLLAEQSSLRDELFRKTTLAERLQQERSDTDLLVSHLQSEIAELKRRLRAEAEGRSQAVAKASALEESLHLIERSAADHESILVFTKGRLEEAEAEVAALRTASSALETEGRDLQLQRSKEIHSAARELSQARQDADQRLTQMRMEKGVLEKIVVLLKKKTADLESRVAAVLYERNDLERRWQLETSEMARRLQEAERMRDKLQLSLALSSGSVSLYSSR